MSGGQPSDGEELQRSYEGRLPLLDALATRLAEETRLALTGVEHIDRVSFRVKAASSFLKKCEAEQNGTKKYASPLEDVEDQVAGRVLVFFRSDIDIVADRLGRRFNRAEHVHKAPESHDSFSYESDHLVFMIGPDVVPTGWESLSSRPTTFELQIRTLFMHAWAEPQHNIAYKTTTPLTHDEKRKLAWAASNAWGGDAIFEQVLASLARRTPPGADNDN